MAVIVPPWILLYISVSTVLVSSCQSFNPQNIETFYPENLPAVPEPNPNLSRNSSSPPAPAPALTPSTSSTNSAVAKAVAATVASTLVVAGLFFFLIRRCAIARRRRSKSVGSGLIRSRSVVPLNDFGRFDGSIKGLVVDENGLDVLYWRKFERRRSQNKVGDDRNEEKEEIVIDQDRREKPNSVQEIPLFRGRSSSSYGIQDPNNPIEANPRFPDSVGIALNYVELAKLPPPQPPPPPKAPAPPPPPPPTPVKKIPPTPPPPVPPPPPPPPGKANVGATTSKTPPVPKRTSSTGNDQVKLKPLHWDKVITNVDHSMVWDKIDGGSFRFDDELMEALFGYVATNKTSPQRSNKSLNPNSPNSSPSAQIVILDPRKSQNTAIVLKSLSISRKEVLDALAEGKQLNEDTLEKLTRIAPTKEEESQILEFDGDPTRLADAESFIFHLLKAVPSAFTRFNAMLFRLNYDSEILHLKDCLQTLELGCKELRNRGLFIKLLEAILKAGNRMNAGTSRGNAHAFDLNALQKLSDVKSTDGKTTLLHFVVEEVVRSEGKRCVINRNRSLSHSSSSRSSSDSSLNTENLNQKDEKEKEYIMLGLPVVGGLSSEFSNVKKSASIDYNSIANKCSALTARAAEIWKLLAQTSIDGNGGGFAREMKGFLEEIEEEVNVMRQEQTRVMDLVRKTTEYYQSKGSKDKGTNPLQLFIIVKDFLAMVDQACIEIARNLQRRRTATASFGSSSNSGVSRTKVRFAKLPEHFVSDKSRTNSSESDDDQ